MYYSIQDFIQLIAQLRNPNGGCPWDLKQNYESMIPCLTEETYEVIDAIQKKDIVNLREELGDLLLQVVFFSQLASEDGYFTFDDVLNDISKKIVRRHPHVFGDATAGNEEEALARWNSIKAQEKSVQEKRSILDDIPNAFPALLRAQKMQKQCSKIGFDWDDVEPVLAKVEEELQEVRDEINQTPRNQEKIEEEKPKEDEEIHESKPDEQSIQDLAQKVDDIPQQQTIQDLVPEPKAEPKNETPPPTNDEKKDVATGVKTQEGTKDTGYQGDQRRDGVEGGQGNQSKRDDSKVVENKVDTNIVHTSVDVEADYGNGGLNGFRAKVAENFDSEAVQGEGMLTTTVKFVVETNGTVSQVKATGSNPDFNREAERVVRSIKGWKPAKKGGVNVRSYYSLPLKMQFQ